MAEEVTVSAVLFCVRAKQERHIYVKFEASMRLNRNCRSRFINLVVDMPFRKFSSMRN